MKRIILFISVFAVFLSCVIFPVAASSIENENAFNPTVLNLLDYPSFEVKVGTNDYSPSDTPSLNVTSSGGTYIRWGENNSLLELSSVVVGIRIDVMPTTMRFVFGGVQYSGTLVGVDTGIYYYSFDINARANDYFQIWSSLPSTYRGFYQIISCVAYLDNCFSINEINVEFYGQQDEEEQFYRQSYYNGSLAVPFNYDNYFESSATAPDQFFVELGYVFHSQNLDSFSIMFSSTNIWPNYYDQASLQQGGFRLMEGDTEIAVLPYSVTDSVMTYFYEGCVQYVYTLTVDLSGYDLTGKSILFNSYLGAVYPNTSSSSTYTMYQFELMAAGYRVDVNSQPWYIRFFNWIKKEFDEIDTALNNFFEVDMPLPDPPDSEMIGDITQDFNDTADHIDSVVGELDSLLSDFTFPDFTELGFEGFADLVAGNINYIVVVFDAFYSNSIVLQITTFSLMFAFVGFLLFGER